VRASAPLRGALARSLQGCQPVPDFPCLAHRLAAWHSPPWSADP
jgi:hypothetical protein